MRFFLTITAFLLLVPGIVRAQGPAHGLSLFGAPALDKNFTHYPYVNPAAPKGGELRVAAVRRPVSDCLPPLEPQSPTVRTAISP